MKLDGVVHKKTLSNVPHHVNYVTERLAFLYLIQNETVRQLNLKAVQNNSVILVQISRSSFPMVIMWNLISNGHNLECNLKWS